MTVQVSKHTYDGICHQIRVALAKIKTGTYPNGRVIEEAELARLDHHLRELRVRKARIEADGIRIA